MYKISQEVDKRIYVFFLNNAKFLLNTAVLRKVVGKSLRDNSEWLYV